MHIFEAGKGINSTKLNDNFDEVKDKANTNETNLSTIASTALLKDGSNLTPEIIDDFKQSEPTVLTTGGNIPLADNTAYFLTLNANGTIVLPTISADLYSHTITLTVMGSSFSLDLGTAYHLLQSVDLDPTNPYNVMYIYDKINSRWNYLVTQ